MSRHIDPTLMDAREGRDLARLAQALGWATWAVTEMPWSEALDRCDETLHLIITDPTSRCSVGVYAFFFDVTDGVPARFSWRPTSFDPNLTPTEGTWSDNMQALRNLIRDHAQPDMEVA